VRIFPHRAGELVAPGPSNVVLFDVPFVVVGEYTTLWTARVEAQLERKPSPARAVEHRGEVGRRGEPFDEDQQVRVGRKDD